MFSIGFFRVFEWLVVLRFNAISTAKFISWQSVFSGFLTQVLTQFFQSHPLLFSHGSVQVSGENMLERNSPQPGLKLTTTRSWVRHAHHWATQAGKRVIESQDCVVMGKYTEPPFAKGLLKSNWNTSAETSIFLLFLVLYLLTSGKNFGWDQTESVLQMDNRMLLKLELLLNGT